MSLISPRLPQTAPFARQKLRHSAGRGDWPCCDWLYYSRVTPFARVLRLLLTCVESYTHVRCTSVYHCLPGSLIETEDAEGRMLLAV